jgi:predicted lysophospholipase L1 biosynthesis ABC-type transport system permease subunit
MQDLYDLALTEEIQIMKQIEFTTNIQTQSAEPKLIKVQGVQEGYPFYGDLELDTTIQTYSSGVWVDAQTYTQYVE